MDLKVRKHIHIVGCSPRSGTTLMQEMMVACFVIDHHCSHERSLFDEDPKKCGVICTKHPREIMYADMALLVNPDLYIIYIVRDPRDVVVSHHAKQPDKYFIGAGFCLQAEAYARKLVSHPRFIVVRYEDLVHAPDKVQRMIVDSLPFLEIRHPFSEFHLVATVSPNSARAMNGVRPPDVSSIGKWRNHLPRIAAQVKKHPEMLDMVRHRGYEPDDEWIHSLPHPDERMNESVIRDHGGWAHSTRLRWKSFRHGMRYWFALTLRGNK